jgi:prepilin-type N-terminal cleavage/methylation domain-containing protein
LPSFFRRRAGSAPRLARQGGFTLVELLLVMSLTTVIVGVTLDALGVITRTQTRDQAYAQEINTTQAAFARLTHDLRQATAFRSVTPNAISFSMVEGGTTYNVAYDCTAADSLGSGHTRCAQSQAVAPALPAAAGSTPRSFDILHIVNGSTSTFCSADGSGQSGSVFFVSNPGIANTDGSNLACDEAYEREIASLGGGPTFVQVKVRVPASGDLASGGLTHTTVFRTGVFLPNLDAGS